MAMKVAMRHLEERREAGQRELDGQIGGTPKRLGYGIRAIVRVGRVEYARVVKLIEQTPEVVNALNVTGEDSWILEIAVIDVEHLDAVVTKFCILTETSTSIVLNAPRENAVVLPARRENIKPAIRKVTGK
jgi:Lrp/AsnC family leucine-responsive transcriptional regulator